MIISEFLTREQLLGELPEFIEEIYEIDASRVLEQLEPLFAIIRKDCLFFLEYPYVDKFYRDTYYHFYSKKHSAYDRDSIRIAIFSDKIDEKIFFTNTIEAHQILNDCFFGIFTIRPTTYRIIGNSFITPRALNNNGFVCCLCAQRFLVNGKSLTAHGFPFSNQDNEVITCAELAIINEMIYFGSRYAEYSILLPSQINKILNKQSYQRQLPSPGLPTENISYVLKKMGFGTVVYASDLYTTEVFKELLYIYLESGIPVIATLSSKKSHHAVILIGRESIKEERNYKEIHEKTHGKLDSEQNHIFKFSDGFNKILIMNDNHPPYELVDFENPLWDESSKGYFTVKSFIVPLYSKVHLEAFQFGELVIVTINNLKKNKETEDIDIFAPKGNNILRCFLTSSKSYKAYIGNSEGLSNEVKSLLIDKEMPKFIWVAEIIFGETLTEKQIVNSIVVMDATESGESGHFIFATNSQQLVFLKKYVSLDSKSQEDANNQLDIISRNLYHVFALDNEVFYTFANNLKGEHTRWLS